MSTDAERRRIASNLRDLSVRLRDGFDRSQIPISLAIITGSIEKHVISWETILDKLADLIEPEPEPERTCHVVTTERKVSQTQTIVTKQCSRCGHIFGSEEHRPFLPGFDEDMVLGEVHIPAYCEDCGSKVVDDAD